MPNLEDTPDELRAVVADAIEQLDPRVASAWSHEYRGNRVKFSGPGPNFSVRDKAGNFTISCEYAPGQHTTRRYDHKETVRFLGKLFHRPAVRKA
jgi:hypothetical protein